MRLIVVESPIDALSYAAVYPGSGRGPVVSTDGAGPLPVGFIAEALAQEGR